MSLDQIITIAQVVFPTVSVLAVAAYHIFVNRLPAEKRQKAEQYINQVVQAVEQTQAEVPGPNRKVQAEALITNILKQQNIKNVSPELVDVLIESAVFSINQNSMLSPTVRIPAVK